MQISGKTLLLAAACLALLSLVFSYGVAVGRYQLFPFHQIRTLKGSIFQSPDQYGRWHRSRETPDLASNKEEALERLSALGYLGGYAPATKAAGATTFDPSSVYDGLTIFSSGHAPVVYLISLAGEVVHKWEIAFEELWPLDLPFETSNEQKQFIRRAHVFPNGDLLAVFEYIGIVKLDRDCNVLWKGLNQNHHDFAVAADGSIVTLVRRPLTSKELARKYPGFESPDSGIFDDQIAFLDPSGVEMKRVSLFEAFYRSEYAPFLSPKTDREDVFHANSVDIVEGHPEQSGIAAGEILVSLRNVNAIVSVDVEKGSVSWMLSGKWRGQHQAQLLSNGNILLLNSHGGNRRAPWKLDQSEVLEINSLTQEVVWRYAGSDESPFFTPWLGYVQRLPNGNTLVTESTQGRIFEVTTEGRIVWEYLNPHRAGDEGELIATVMGAQRVSPEDLEFLQP
ncbi:MAG: arylsulfotransferase family protein [Planctomycetota bacterium]|jgi:hypothetical protein